MLNKIKNKLKVVVACGNGTAGIFAPKILKSIGWSLDSLSVVFDSAFKAIKVIQQSIFDRVQLECKKRNIDLVFIECLSAMYEHIRIDFKYLEYPLIRNLETVSRTECQPGTYEFLAGGDSRAGHMNGHNNKLCADEIIKCFEDTTPRLVNFDEVPGLDYTEETFNFYWERQANGSINPRYN